jgi:hypothetical protein
VNIAGARGNTRRRYSGCLVTSCRPSNANGASYATNSVSQSVDRFAK